jgi:hypothetical protein
MKLADLQNIPQFDLLAPQLLLRVQHSSARAGTVKIGKQHEVIWASTKAAVA